MEWIKPTIKHVLVVAASCGVAYFAWRILGLESPITLGLFSLIVVAAEKLVRSHPDIPVGDFVNLN